MMVNEGGDGGVGEGMVAGTYPLILLGKNNVTTNDVMIQGMTM